MTSGRLDLKPQNIMVEQGALGWQPVIMDFGLAREAGEGKGLTESGAVLGTPAYMSPEQARGDVRILDRRTDVYSLGATLYDLLAGEPPFDAESVVDLLLYVLDREPKPLRSRAPNVPPALEIIVMKCLAKEREQRFESAAALADDLDRFLLGESIRARRTSLYLRGRRWVLKHRALSAVSLVSLLLVIGLGINGLRQRYQAQLAAKRAERRALVERQLAQRLKEIVWLLRVAYALPAHDIRFEQAAVRSRMAEMTRLGLGGQSDLGRLGEALVSYALAEGHLALHEFSAAHERLLAAQAAGLDSAELHHALGRTLGALFDQGMAEARRAGDKTWQEKRRQELTRQYLEPSLRSLEKSRSLELESPEYLEGLIAYYRRDYDAAQAKARRAAALLPWLYEAHALRGHARYEQAVLQKDRGEYDAARASLREALGYYQTAADIGRSDGSNYDALATAWQLHADLDRTQGKPQDEAMQRSIAACDLLITTDPHKSVGHTKKARAYLFLAWPLINKGKDPRDLLKKLISSAERAISIDPVDAYAYDMLGNGYSVLGRYEEAHEQNPEHSWKLALEKLDRAAAIMPNFPWAHNDRAIVLRKRAEWLSDNGRDPQADYLQSIRSLEQAVQVDPAYQSAYSNLVKSHGLLAGHLMEHGIDPADSIKKSDYYADKLSALNPNFSNLYLNRSFQRITYAEFLFESGKDPSVIIKGARDDVEKSLINDNDPIMGNYYLSYIKYVESKNLISQKKSAVAEISRGLAAAKRCQSLSPDGPGCFMMEARLLVLRGDLDKQAGRSARPLLLQALAAARAAVALDAEDARARLTLARVHLRVAGEPAAQPAAQELLEGLRHVQQALKIDAKLAEAHAVRGCLYLRLAQLDRSAVGRSSAAREAQGSFARAFAINGLLRRVYGEEVSATAALVNRAAP